ncbi:ABC transporter transmembrane domain-containing protein [Roseibium salinum]|nr:ABC transporter transmembrane domain-containing protein [Roseibium salinum]
MTAFLPNKATSTLLALAVGVGLAMVFDFSAADRALVHYRQDRPRARPQSVLPAVRQGLALQAGGGLLLDRGVCQPNQPDRVRAGVFFASNTLVTLIDALFIFVFLVVIYLVAGWLFIIPAIAFVLATAVGLVAQARIGRKVARAANESSQRQSLLVESLSTLETIKSLRAEAALLANWTLLTKKTPPAHPRKSRVCPRACSI